jgi:hypothetical protein
VHLKEFCFISPVIESAEVFRAIETAIASDAIEQAIGETGGGSKLTSSSWHLAPFSTSSKKPDL